eukprot:4772333-Alexandrium_andersonii.AAC.1
MPRAPPLDCLLRDDRARVRSAFPHPLLRAHGRRGVAVRGVFASHGPHGEGPVLGLLPPLRRLSSHARTRLPVPQTGEG